MLSHVDQVTQDQLGVRGGPLLVGQHLVHQEQPLGDGSRLFMHGIRGNQTPLQLIHLDQEWLRLLQVVHRTQQSHTHRRDAIQGRLGLRSA